MRYCPTCGARFSEEVGFCPTDGSPTGEMEDPTTTEDPLIGRVIDGRYRVLEQLGEGGMGVVYLATHTVLGKKLALKVLRGEMAKDPETVKRFQQEAQAATSIGQQNIIDISDFGQLPDGTTYFVMEHLDGLALTKLIKQGGSIPMADAIRIVRQIASALGAAHQVGVVHRDLKPDNVMLISRGGDPYFVKVLDFGIAKVGGAASKLTKTGMVFGTPHYMAPEQAAGQAVDQRTDVYALGVMMYEMFTGKVPFDADTFMAILSKHMFEPPIPPSAQGSDVKLGAIEDVILKALAKKPEDRYQKMEELVVDLDTLASGGSIEIGGSSGVTPPGNLADHLEPPSRTEMRISTNEPVEIPGNKSGLPLFIGFIFLLLLGGGAAAVAFFLLADDAPTSTPPLVAEAPDSTVAQDDPQDAGPVLDAAQQVVTADEPEAPRVQITSDPAGASVLIEGAIVGNTPLELRRPDGEAFLDIQIRMRGRLAQSVRILSTSPESIDVALEEEEEEERDRDRPSMMRNGMMRPSGSDEEPDPEPQMMRPTSDVVDPWANE